MVIVLLQQKILELSQHRADVILNIILLIRFQVSVTNMKRPQHVQESLQQILPMLAEDTALTMFVITRIQDTHNQYQ